MTKKRGQRKTGWNQEQKKGNEPSENVGEYLDMVDSEAKRKYEHRKLESNWARYEANAVGERSGEPEQESPLTEDFKVLLENASSDCSHFEFSSEKLWKAREPATTPSEMFNLNLELLSAGLACVPFYERIGMDRNELSPWELETYDKEAHSNRELYDCLEKDIHKSRGSTRSTGYFLNDVSKQVKRTSKGLGSCTNSDATNKGETKKSEYLVHKNHSEGVQSKLNEVSRLNKEGSLTGSPPSKSIFSDKDNLEDWLDGILGD